MPRESENNHGDRGRRRVASSLLANRLPKGEKNRVTISELGMAFARSVIHSNRLNMNRVLKVSVEMFSTDFIEYTV